MAQTGARKNMHLSQIMAAIEKIAPLHIAAGWDHSGLQVPGRRDGIRKLAVCLDPSPTSVSTALDMGAHMVLTHHPLTLSPRFPDTEGPFLDVLRLLIRADVPLYAAHTSLDANPKGPAGWLARALGMEQPEVLEPSGEMHDADGTPYVCGFGQSGRLASAVTLASILKLIPGCACPRLAGANAGMPENISHAAICPGSGSSLAARAAKTGAQLLITGDLKYHDALETPLPILDVGHFALEEQMTRLFAGMLAENLPDLEVFFVPASDPFFNPCCKSPAGGLE